MEKHMGQDAELVMREVRLLVRKGDVPAARARIDAFCQELANKLGADEETVAAARNLMDSALHYAGGDDAAYRKVLEKMKGEDARFEAALFDKNVDAARKALAEVKPPTAVEHLLLYIVAQSSGRKDVAEAMWTRSIELLNKSHRDDRLFAKELSGAGPPSEKALHNWTAPPLERAIVMTALGLRYPQKRDEFFAAARKLNFAHRYPQRLLAQVTQ
jgi:hypothetical protein